MHCMLCIVSNTYTFALDPAELEPEELSKPAPAEETNPEQARQAPVHLTLSLSFVFLIPCYDS
jgi:hypothetical protein